jgi:hypothetical protein
MVGFQLAIYFFMHSTQPVTSTISHTSSHMFTLLHLVAIDPDLLALRVIGFVQGNNHWYQ